MSSYGLLLYYLVLYSIPWGLEPGYEYLWHHSDEFLSSSMPPWLRFTLLMGGAFIASLGIGFGTWKLLDRDDQRWQGLSKSIMGVGWLKWVDLLIPVLAVTCLIVSLLNHLSHHGLLAAIIPAVIVFLPIWRGKNHKSPS